MIANHKCKSQESIIHLGCLDLDRLSLLTPFFNLITLLSTQKNWVETVTAKSELSISMLRSINWIPVLTFRTFPPVFLFLSMHSLYNVCRSTHHFTFYLWLAWSSYHNKIKQYPRRLIYFRPDTFSAIRFQLSMIYLSLSLFFPRY